MMGNFLTTLGNTPDEDKAMFSELGLNVAAHPDNGANPRPDNRSGWLEGETPDLVGEMLTPPTAGGAAGSADTPPLTVRLWDPTTQLKFAAKRSVPPRPDGAPNSGQGRETREAAARRANAA
jgi:biotin synthase